MSDITNVPQRREEAPIIDPLVDANRNLAEALKGPSALPADSVVLAPDVFTTWFANKPEPFLPPDVERPSVSLTEVTPQPNSRVSAVDTREIKAVFTEQMNRATLTPLTFTLTKIKGTTETQVTAAEVSYDAKTKTATLRLEGSLEALSAPNKYEATVKGGRDGVKDLAGNLLGLPEREPPLEPPAEGESEIEIDGTVVIKVTAGGTVTEFSWFFFTDGGQGASGAA
jgi:hypothetical protein